MAERKWFRVEWGIMPDGSMYEESSGPVIERSSWGQSRVDMDTDGSRNWLGDPNGDWFLSWNTQSSITWYTLYTKKEV